MKTLPKIIGVIENGKFYTDRGGRVQCGVCGSISGVRVWCRHIPSRGYPLLKRTCVGCGAFQKTNNYTGEVLEVSYDKELARKTNLIEV